MHIPVLVNEVLKYLDPQPNENFIDATFGFGGHGYAILNKTKPAGKVLGIEWDRQIYNLIQKRIAENPKRLILVSGSFADLEKIVRQVREQCRDSSPEPALSASEVARNDMVINGVLFDLGFSSWHIEKSGRGFSFLRDEPLDMRYSRGGIAPRSFGLAKARPQDDTSSHSEPAGEESLRSFAAVQDDNTAVQDDNGSLTAAMIVNQWSEEELIRIFKEYGEERFAQRIAGAICAARQKTAIKSSKQLAELIEKNLPAKYQYGRLHPATRTFQALRIAVNNELNNLKKGLKAALRILSPGGRLVVISFHSLEDRIVKHFFRDQKQAGNLEILTKKPIVPTDQEIKENPRSRSAKLRAAVRISN